MLWIQIKNNAKLMLRGKFIILLMIIAPVIISGAVANAFSALLDSDFKTEDLLIGYSLEENSSQKAFFDSSEEELKKNGVSMVAVGQESGTKCVEEKTLDAFLQETDDGITVYTLSKDGYAAQMLQYTLNQFYSQHDLMAAGRGGMASGADEAAGLPAVTIVRGQLDGLKLPAATDYYGIVETVYFLWSAMLLLTYPVSSERKNRISGRLAVSPANSFVLYMGKFIPCFAMSLICTLLSALISTSLFDISWGSLPLTIGIIILGTMAGTAFGTVVLYLVNNLAVAVILEFTIIWIAGFIGGSFQTYMFARIPEGLALTSPIYHMNRALIELSTVGHSDYLLSSVLFCLAVTAVGVLLGSLLMKRRMEVE